MLASAYPAPVSAGTPAFTDASAVRLVHREAAVLLGGGRALVLQLSHPGVAAGVAAHSRFRRDRLQRLLNTLRRMLAIAFGTPEQLQAAAGAVNAQHARVRGPGYDALDPDLLLWVLATLIDTSIEVHARFLHRLSGEEEQAYYADMLQVGELLGLPPRHAPPDMEAFREYFAAAVATLAPSEQSRALVHEVLRPPGVLRPAFMLVEQLTAGLLPPRLRVELGLDWGPRREAALRALESASRALLPRLPLMLRRTPAFLLPPAGQETRRG